SGASSSTSSSSGSTTAPAEGGAGRRNPLSPRIRDERVKPCSEVMVSTIERPQVTAAPPPAPKSRKVVRRTVKGRQNGTPAAPPVPRGPASGARGGAGQWRRSVRVAPAAT